MKILYKTPIFRVKKMGGFQNHVKCQGEVVKNVLFRLFCKSRERIKRNTLIGQITDGEIGVVDLYSKYKSLKAAWISCLLENKGNLYELMNITGISCIS